MDFVFISKTIAAKIYDAPENGEKFTGLYRSLKENAIFAKVLNYGKKIY